MALGFILIHYTHMQLSSWNNVIKSNSQIYCCHGRVALSKASRNRPKVVHHRVSLSIRRKKSARRKRCAKKNKVCTKKNKVRRSPKQVRLVRLMSSSCFFTLEPRVE
jgi:hypothetical protein